MGSHFASELPSPISKDKLGLGLIILSSALLGIWAVKDVIALRNILLVLGSVTSIFYIVKQYKSQDWRIELSIINSAPLILVALMFVWVILHYLFLSHYPQEQLQELTSTWVRSALGSIVAMGIALALSKRPQLIHLLWVGIFLSFLILLGQYIPRSIANHSLFASDWYGGSYIFIGKINGVLAGTVMVSGLTGGLFVFLGLASRSNLVKPMLFCLLGILLALYAYVFIFEARNGIGMTVLVMASAILWAALNLLSVQDQKINKNTLRRLLAVLCLTLIVAFAFGKIQATKSAGWQTLIDDIRTALQVEKFHHWQDPVALGYPESAPGRMVVANTYERTAWATAGLTIFVPQNPLGIGVLSRSFPRLLENQFGKKVDYIPSTHSAWVDLILSYGLPGIFLLLGSLLLTLYRSVRGQKPMDGFIFVQAMSCGLLYTVGELSVQHGIEILMYWLTLLASLSLLGIRHTRINSPSPK